MTLISQLLQNSRSIDYFSNTNMSMILFIVANTYYSNSYNGIDWM